MKLSGTPATHAMMAAEAGTLRVPARVSRPHSRDAAPHERGAYTDLEEDLLDGVDEEEFDHAHR